VALRMILHCEHQNTAEAVAYIVLLSTASSHQHLTGFICILPQVLL
jgi:hypothetical protein